MATFKLSAGAEIDLLTKPELDDALQSEALAQVQERARGIKPMRFVGRSGLALTATTAVVIPYTPSQGYVWAVRLVATSFSGTAANLRAWITSDANITSLPVPNNMIPIGSTGNSSLSVALQFSGTQVLMYGGEYIVLNVSTTPTLDNYVLAVVETPAELLWKLV